MASAPACADPSEPSATGAAHHILPDIRLFGDPRLKVIVTGASGFVGAALVEELLKRRIEVHALGRTAIPGCETLFCEFPSRVPRLPAADAVIHLASPSPSGDDGVDATLFHDVLVSGTERLLEEMARAGIPRLIFASSVKAIGEDSGDAAWTEETVEKPESAYGASKLAVERLLAGSASFTTTSLRFPILYGPGMRTKNMLTLFKAVQRGVPLPLGRIRNRRTLLYVDHAVDAVVRVLCAETLRRPLYMVGDDPAVSTTHLVTRIAEALRRPARLLPLPQTALLTLGHAGDVLPPQIPALRTAHVRRLVGNLEVNSSKIREELGFASHLRLDEALLRTAEWYKNVF